jgi:hypothetical protein
MALLPPLPPVTSRWIDAAGLPSQAVRQYMTALDQVVRRLAAGHIGPLANAADDAMAAEAGIPIGGLYQSDGVVRIRIS